MSSSICCPTADEGEGGNACNVSFPDLLLCDGNTSIQSGGEKEAMMKNMSMPSWIRRSRQATSRDPPTAASEEEDVDEDLLNRLLSDGEQLIQNNKNSLIDDEKEDSHNDDDEASDDGAVVVNPSDFYDDEEEEDCSSSYSNRHDHPKKRDFLEELTGHGGATASVVSSSLTSRHHNRHASSEEDEDAAASSRDMYHEREHDQVVTASENQPQPQPIFYSPCDPTSSETGSHEDSDDYNVCANDRANLDIPELSQEREDEQVGQEEKVENDHDDDVQGSFHDDNAEWKGEGSQKEQRLQAEEADDSPIDDSEYDDDDDEDDETSVGNGNYDSGSDVDAAALLERARDRIARQHLQNEVNRLQAIIDRKNADIENLSGQLRRAIETKCDLVIAHNELEKSHENHMKRKQSNLVQMKKANMFLLESQSANEKELLNELMKLEEKCRDMEQNHQSELDDWERLHRNEMLEKDYQIAQLTEELRRAQRQYAAPSVKKDKKAKSPPKKFFLNQ